jgi:excinuclease ABC subunit A
VRGPVQRQSAQEIVETIIAMPEGSRLLISRSVVRERKGTYQAVLEEISKSGFVRGARGRRSVLTRRQNPA